jgi:DNA ligase-associated metallophosphoesterase
MIWKEKRLLILGDLHIGKVSHFRHAGLAVPADALHENFARLDSVMNNYEITEVLFAGDLFHSSINKEWQLFHEWRTQYAHIPMSIVLGNHDKLARHYYEDAQLQIFEEYFIDPFTFTHHPKEIVKDDEYVISGHVHPVILITGKARQQLKFPCFYFGAQQCILPAFGYFTGGHIIDPVKGDLVVALVSGELMDVSQSVE